MFTEPGWEPSDISYFNFCVYFSLIVYLFETYLNYRQHQNLCVQELPKLLSNTISKLDQDTKYVNTIKSSKY